jgi:tRNA(Ile)-lysidine synthase
MIGAAESFSRAWCRLSPSSTLLLGVSGGLDSMALLELVSHFEERHKLIVAHFNHQLRGDESDGDEAFVREQASHRNLPFVSARGDVRAAAKGISIEMAARQLRHEFLAKVARENSADILLAHHADDQIELFLMRLLRGIEGPGLACMRMISPSPSDPNIRILRPLLETFRAELAAFSDENKIPFREDATNAELHADRNRIRHQIIPILREEAGPNFQSNLLRHIAATRDQGELARSAARAWLQERAEFSNLPDWLRREIIATQLDDAKIPVTAQSLDALLKADGARVSINAAQTVALDSHGQLQIFNQLWPADSIALTLSSEGAAEFSNLTLSWSFPTEPDLSPLPNQMTFDADKVGTQITLRHWRQGDRIHLSGRSSNRPLHEMFSRNKIPRDQRHRLVVAATAAGEIFWVEGLRVTENFKVTPASKRFLNWRWQPRR